MRLAHLINSNMEALLEDWEEAALKIAPELEGEDSEALRDHARSMLEFIYHELVTSRTNDESVRKALGKGKAPASAKHAMDRVKQGLSMFQMVQEFRALRARVTFAWSDREGGLTEQDIDELVRFNEAVDQLIANSVSSFSALKEQETRLIETMLKASPDPAAIFDPDGRILFINSAMADLVGALPRDVIGKTPLELGNNFAEDFQDEIATTVTTRKTHRTEIHRCMPSGREMYLDCLLVPVFDDQNEVEAVVKTTRDITERKKNEFQVWRSANFDSLTRIPNRRLFLDRLEQTLREAQRRDSAFSLLFIDLDHFKQANDQLGHAAGDRLLAQVAERISTKVRAMDTLARLGGDEFTLILKETDRRGAKEAAKALLTSLEEAFHVDSHCVHISGSIGLTLFPDDGEDADQLMHNADQAMYAAKERGGQQVQVYEAWMARDESEHMRLNRELHEAISENQLEVHYQPIIDIRTGAVVRAEALLRWNHPSKGLLTPGDFLSVTGQNGMIDSITNYVLEQAVLCSFRWSESSDKAFPVSVNESPTSFATRSLVDHWRERRTQISLDGSWITVELTPTSFNNIRASGFDLMDGLGSSRPRLKLAVDEFGIELISLLALQETELDCVKIDKELMKGAGQGGNIDHVLEGIIAMAHAINVQVVGVGVERDEQLQFLSRAGCDYAQGFLFSKALRQDEFETLLKKDRQIQHNIGKV